MPSSRKPKRSAAHTRAGRVTKPAASPSAAAPQPAPRYTPKKPTYRLRPGWHRFAGWLGVIVGIGVVVGNDAMLIAENLTLLPGGHAELYLILGLAIAGGATWFLGVFDRGTTVYRSRGG